MEEFNKKFQIEELKIKTVGSWIISLRPQQVTLGSLVLSLNRKCQNFGNLTEKEGQELAQAFRVVEEILEVTYNPNKINYLALMMVDNQVHFHVIPRYARSIEFDGNYFKDEEWPNPPTLTKSLDLTNLQLLDLRDTVRNNN